MLFDRIRQRIGALVPGRLTAMPWHLARQGARRLGWGVAEQGVSSITNFAVNIYIARELGAVQYGAFSLAYVTYGFALNASRGLATDPLLVRFSGTDLPTWRRAVAMCTGTAAAVGLAAGLLVLAAGLLMSGPSRLAFLALGLTLPGLLLQDSWRFSFFALGRGRRGGRRSRAVPGPGHPPVDAGPGVAVPPARSRAAVHGGGDVQRRCFAAAQLRRGADPRPGRGGLCASGQHAGGAVHGHPVRVGSGGAARGREAVGPLTASHAPAVRADQRRPDAARDRVGCGAAGRA